MHFENYLFLLVVHDLLFDEVQKESLFASRTLDHENCVKVSREEDTVSGQKLIRH